jgi:LDH2 family malate/lactate/ureidoglycolate dehydrogenase
VNSISQPQSTRTIGFDALHRFTMAAFQAAGLSETDAKTGADVLTMTDASGGFTPGTKCLAG